MGETQIYSLRLHGITEKRRILSEVDRIQRELEQQRVKLHQLKRKSLRDRWLMDGLVPAAGAEMDNPLSETEAHIKELELQLDNLQSELVYLENPELKALKGVKVQGVTLQKELVNGERNVQNVDQNENLKEHPITEETDQPNDSRRDKPTLSQETDHSGDSQGEKPTVSQETDHPGHSQGEKPTVSQETDRPGHSQGEKPTVSQETDHPGHSQGEQPTVSQETDHPGHIQGEKPTVSQKTDHPGHSQEEKLTVSQETDHPVQSQGEKLSVSQETNHSGHSQRETPAISHKIDHQGQSQGEIPAVSQKDLEQSTEVVVEHPVSAPQSTSISENNEVEHSMAQGLPKSNEPDDKQTHPSQNADGFVQKVGVHISLNEEHETQNSEHSPKHQEQYGEHLALAGDTQELRSLASTLEKEDQNISSTSDLGSDSPKTDELQPSSGKEDLNVDLFPQDQSGKESLLDEITKLVGFGDPGETSQQNQDGTKPHLSSEHLSLGSLEVHPNEEPSQHLEENKASVLISHEQGHTTDEERGQPDSPNLQEEPKKPVAVCMEIDAPISGSVLDQSSVLPPSDQEVCTTLPSTDQVPSQLPLSGNKNQADQVQISQVIVIAASEKPSSKTPQDLSVSHKSKETSTAPESQPLLQKPQETDSHHGANTAETRDKSTPTKKKTCQCCVVM